MEGRENERVFLCVCAREKGGRGLRKALRAGVAKTEAEKNTDKRER